MRDFEKHIQEKADAFEMSPLQDTFDKVMAALEKKKKRRFIFWLWFIIPGFAIGGTIGVYKMMSGSDKLTLAQKKTEEISVTNESSNTTNNTTTYSNKETIVTSNNYSDPTTTDTKESTIGTSTEQNSAVNKKETTTLSSKKDKLNNTTSIKKDVVVTNVRTNSNANFLSKENTNDQKSISAIEPKQRINESTIHLFSSSLILVQPSQQRTLFSTKDVPLVPAIQPNSPEFRIAKRKKFSIGIYTDLGVSKSTFYTEIPADSTPKGNYVPVRSASDKFLFSYSAGLQFRYSPIRFLTIETGIGFTRYQSYQIIVDGGMSSSMVMDINDPDTAYSIAAFSGNPSSKEFYNTYDYISIPVKLFYQKRWQWFGLEAGGGVIFDIPVNTYSYTADENTGVSYLTKTVNNSRLNMFGIQASGNVNAVFHVKQFSFFIGPTFKYRMNSMFDSNYIMEQRPYFIGGQLGVRYNF